MVEDCDTAMRYLVCRAAGSDVMFSSGVAAGLGRGSPSALGSPGTVCCACPTSRAIRNAATSSPALISEALNAGIPSRLIEAWTTQRISTRTAGIRSLEIAPAQLGMKSPALRNTASASDSASHLHGLTLGIARNLSAACLSDFVSAALEPSNLPAN